MTDRTSGKEEQINGRLTRSENKQSKKRNEEPSLISNSFHGAMLDFFLFFFFLQERSDLIEIIV